MRRLNVEKKADIKEKHRHKYAIIDRTKVSANEKRIGQLKNVDSYDIDIKGDLAARSGLTFTRLEGKWFRPDEVFTADQHGWPGDWEGRIILGLTMLAQSTHRSPAYLETILSMLPEYLNERGYIGKIPPKGVTNEQQMAGHSWLLRGLVEYYIWKKDAGIFSIITTLVKNFVLPAKANYQNYPLGLDERNETRDWQLSHPQSKNKQHSETIDTGCAFIMIDGVTSAYELLRLPELKELAEVMIERFSHINLVDIQVQTHATLTATRGIIRFYELTGDVKYLHLAEKLFCLYKSEAWTENYGNCNWFSRPRWTEACAIIDSFIVATWLWKNTLNPTYLEDAHHIYFNAMCYAQRDNGGFGTDNCLGAEDVFLHPHNFECYWCCTMRGGEGLSRAIEFNFFTDGKTLFVPFYNDCTADLYFIDGMVRVNEKTGYPYDGKVILEIMESTLQCKQEIRFFAPNWTSQNRTMIYLNNSMVQGVFKDGFIVINANLEKGDRIEFDLCLDLHVMDAIGKNNFAGFHTFRHGPLILAGQERHNRRNVGRDAVLERIGKCTYFAEEPDVKLSPLYGIDFLTHAESKRQVLFSED